MSAEIENTARKSPQTMSSSSGMMRFAVPLLLLAALLLVTMKFCSEQGKSRVVAEERSVLQQELASAQEQADINTAKMESLESEYSSAQAAAQAAAKADKEQLQSDLQSVITELEELRDVPTDTAELQQRLSEVITERDEALENSSLLAEQLDEIRLDRDKINQQRVVLTSDLFIANQNITANADTITSLRTEVDSLTLQIKSKDDEIVEQAATNVTLTKRVATLNQANKDSIQSNNQLLKEFNTLELDFRQSQDDLVQTNSTISSLNRQKTDAINQIGSLAQLSKQGKDNLVQANSTISALNRQKTEGINRIGSLAQLSKQTQEDLMQANSTISALNKQKTEAINQIGSLAQLSEQAKDDLMQANSTISSLNRQKTEGINQIGSLAQVGKQTQDDLMQANSTISSLNRQKTEAINQIGSLAQVGKQTQDDLMQANSTISSLNRKKTEGINQIGSLLSQLNELENNVAMLTEQQLKQQQEWAKANDTAILNIVALEQSLSKSSREIAQLTSQRNKMQSAVDAESAKAKVLTSDTQALRDILKKKLSDAGVKSVLVKSIENDRAVAMTLGSGGLFRKGDVSLTREGAEVLGAIGKVVTNYPDWQIDVEGHTDSHPIGKKLRQRYPSNWELSSARASAVINFLRFTTDVKTEKLSARGFAETRPVADNNSPSGRNQNRRVDIILRR